jgi:site-specific DNA-cytosine methylase
MEVIWQSEIDPYGCRVLKKHWPEVVNHGNIKEINWGDVVRPDIICGGYPCQPFSTAGKRNGTDDPRHLWPWVREAISELRPKYAILENVRGHVSLGLNVVLGEMASIGYDAEWQIVSAASVGAPHRQRSCHHCGLPQSAQLARTSNNSAMFTQTTQVYTAKRLAGCTQSHWVRQYKCGRHQRWLRKLANTTQQLDKQWRSLISIQDGPDNLETVVGRSTDVADTTAHRETRAQQQEGDSLKTQHWGTRLVAD